MDENKIEDASSSDELEEEAETDDLESDSDEETVESSESEEDQTPNEDEYASELERERARLGKKIDKERQKRIEAEKNKGLSREEIKQMIDEGLSQTEKRIQRNQMEELANRLSNSTSEKDLILHHYENSIIPSGNLEEDMKRAYLLANSKRLESTISELKKTIAHKKTTSSGGSAGTPVEQKPPKKYSKDVIDGAKFAGVTPEEFVKVNY